MATLLEIATQLGADPSVQNTVRFGFFGDEESGPQGSTGYLEGLSADDRRKIKLYLNVDMVASPNGGYFVQGGEWGCGGDLAGKGRDEEEAGPPGSATIGRVLADQLVKTGVAAPEIIEFVGDDESPFIEAGIPVGGAESGDDEEKTARQAKAWGGRAGEVYDPATTRPATPSTTSTATCSTTTCGPSLAPWPTSQHPQTAALRPVQVESQDDRGQQDPSLADPASVEAADVVAVDDQTIPGQLGGEGLVVWVEDDLGLLVVQPLPDQREPGLIHRLLGGEQQPVPVRAVRPGSVPASRSCSAGVATRSTTPSGSGASGSASIPIAQTRETGATAAAA